MADKPKATPMRLRVITCQSVFSGTNRRGEPYSIYELTACKEDGTVIEGQKLRSFEDMPLGEVLDVTVTPFTSDKGEKSFTIARKNRAGSTQRINEMQQQLSAVEERLKKVEGYLREQARKQQPAATVTQEPPSTTDDLDARFGADPQF